MSKVPYKVGEYHLLLNKVLPTELNVQWKLLLSSPISTWLSMAGLNIKLPGACYSEP